MRIEEGAPLFVQGDRIDVAKPPSVHQDLCTGHRAVEVRERNRVTVFDSMFQYSYCSSIQLNGRPGKSALIIDFAPGAEKAAFAWDYSTNSIG